jgi:hypothetical protein
VSSALNGINALPTVVLMREIQFKGAPNLSLDCCVVLGVIWKLEIRCEQ